MNAHLPRPKRPPAGELLPTHPAPSARSTAVEQWEHTLLDALAKVADVVSARPARNEADITAPPRPHTVAGVAVLDYLRAALVGISAPLHPATALDYLRAALPDAPEMSAHSSVPQIGADTATENFLATLPGAAIPGAAIPGAAIPSAAIPGATSNFACHTAAPDWLPDQRFLLDRIDVALAAASADAASAAPRSMAVAMLSLDGLGAVYTAHGQSAVHALLGAAALRLASVIRPSDVLTRSDVGTFGCLLANAPAAPELENLAFRMFNALSSPFALRSTRVSVRPSVGFAVFPRDGMTSELLLGRATAASLMAAQSGEGLIFHSHTADA